MKSQKGHVTKHSVILIIKKGGFEWFNTNQTRPTSRTLKETYLIETNLEPDSLANLKYISL